MGNLISKIQSISGVLSIFLLIVVIALLVCVVSLFLEVNRLNQKYRVFMKGRDGQSLEKSFRRKFAMIDKGLDAAAANEQEIEKLKEIIADVLNVEVNDITEDTTFVDDLGADSLDIFQIIMGIEETFDIEIDNDDAEQISTVGDAVEQIKNATNNN